MYVYVCIFRLQFNYNIYVWPCVCVVALLMLISDNILEFKLFVFWFSLWSLRVPRRRHSIKSVTDEERICIFSSFIWGNNFLCLDPCWLFFRSTKVGFHIATKILFPIPTSPQNTETFLFLFLQVLITCEQI